jgi:ubiquinone/menaquinone biosynthesis C-methylase UbiE
MKPDSPSGNQIPARPRKSHFLSPSAAAFDTMAASYDADATHVMLAHWLREQVWARLGKLFATGDRVLEIGCGTGEDALWLARRGVYVTATDGSPAMLEVAKRKIQQAKLDSFVEFRLLDLAAVPTWELPIGAYDGAFSNFGALNCVGSWTDLGEMLARVVKRGGHLGFGVMGPVCLWEIGYHLLRGRRKLATRRWQGSANAHLNGLPFTVYYPTLQHLQRELGTAFTRRALRGIGVFVPPSDLYAAVGSRPRLARLLMKLDSAVSSRWPFTTLGDHYWLELERTPQKTSKS